MFIEYFNVDVYTILSASIIIGITVSFIFYNMLVGQIQVLVSFFIFSDFHSMVRRDVKDYYSVASLFYLLLIINTSSGSEQKYLLEMI